MEENFSIINKTKSKLPPLPFLKIKNDILGKKYSLSIAYVAENKSKEINKKYRKKDRATNILSFSLRENEGELILCPTVVKREAKDFSKTFDQFLGFLVIHGMLHLKGMTHSSTMEKAERKYDEKYFSGNRPRLLNDESRGGRIFKRRKKS
ncbi:rRNA maturation RNase YbeY [Candidatus Nomurabacteria bacterium RIFCSPHIGHO2_01_FULL_37_25]|uniref:Endoribonuclease YbeY n=1 Tax=Candidatus Nomurabacteria bacterium RIFCSPLOWO2_01_FULL_36_16 TaxID=1801767 RepID=A0A1F6X0R9_9BACT|nr:MAG: rRNA maturation RNase YbeY [Candidatus Nomurabacteria bacterium RIFCSPHIGHO2_01_FULL_37_25]OGI75054.1 MAG: rRNA maturation RNase YbeY [Candidatus Nomurabacteria bacterium RIFCSPHIGHO2_02_FULL_36_29]OGI87565.1 MAG: rRNA maturation RNase YbeY [Candidatus Nomurabacteria bacterium RIFCSPLOWO2_01_FULL_36_16]